MHRLFAYTEHGSATKGPRSSIRRSFVWLFCIAMSLVGVTTSTFAQNRQGRIAEIAAELDELESSGVDIEAVLAEPCSGSSCSLRRTLGRLINAIHQLRSVALRDRLEALMRPLRFDDPLSLVRNLLLLRERRRPVFVAEQPGASRLSEPSPSTGEHWRITLRHRRAGSVVVYVELCGHTLGSFAVRNVVRRSSGRWWIARRSAFTTHRSDGTPSCEGSSLVPPAQ